MAPGLLVRLRPEGPWRFGPESGERHRSDALYRSDTVYAAVSWAMERLGLLEEWLGATAEAAAGSQVRFSSCFPWQQETLYVVPPRSHWPAASVKLRTKGARFVPASLAASLLADAPLEEDRWIVDGWSRCLLPQGGRQPAAGPFRETVRSFLAVDRRQEGNVIGHRAACIEFAPDAGLWCFAAFSDEEARTRWSVPLEGAFRLLADSGFGGRRSIGWGRATIVEIGVRSLDELLPAAARATLGEEPQAPAEEGLYWLLSLFRPGPCDRIDWSRGSYSLVRRSGRIESRYGAGALKKVLPMVEEGSVLAAAAAPVGSACDVAPEGFPHPVYRAGWAVSVRIGKGSAG